MARLGLQKNFEQRRQKIPTVRNGKKFIISRNRLEALQEVDQILFKMHLMNVLNLALLSILVCSSPSLSHTHTHTHVKTPALALRGPAEAHLHNLSCLQLIGV